MKIVVLSMLESKGSGYAHIVLPLCDGLSRNGHDIKVIGLGSRGEQHNFDFSIFPAKDIRECQAMIQNLYNVLQFDVLMVAMDLPLQGEFMKQMATRPFKYIGIFPVESDPLNFTSAMNIMQMDKPFVISEFGLEEVKKRGISHADHLPVGIDTLSWRIPTTEERTRLRSAMGYTEDNYVFLTVAENQERKNLDFALNIFSKFAEKHPNARYVVITSKDAMVGWRLDDLAQDYGCIDKFSVVDKGIPFKDLWTFYAIADVFLLSSKAEGLGLPLLEAMSVGVPCIGTDCTGIKELLSDGRGILAPYYDFDGNIPHDPFGNGHRYWIDVNGTVEKLLWMYDNKEEVKNMAQVARMYVENRTWKKSVHVIERYLKTINGETEEPKTSTTPAIY